MQTLIIEDEDLVRELLIENIRQIPFLKLAGACRTANEAFDVLHREGVDLILLDIHMPGITGLQFLKALESPPLIVMVTAHQDYAVEAFDLNVVDYVLKPFSFQRILKACQKAYRRHIVDKESNAITPASRYGSLFVNSDYALVRIVIEDINYIEGMKDYIKIHVHSAPNPVITRMTIKSIQEKLPRAQFLRTHKSFIVALSKIASIGRDSVSIGQKEIPLSGLFREEVMRIVQQV